MEKGPATFGVIKRLRDNDMELHTDRQVRYHESFTHWNDSDM